MNFGLLALLDITFSNEHRPVTQQVPIITMSVKSGIIAYAKLL